MPGLLDVAKSFRTVNVKGVAVDVPGVSAEGIAYLFSRFPVIRELVGGKPDVDFSADALIKLAPEAVSAIIAVGTGAVNDKDAETVAATLGAEAQMNLLQAIVEETMPSGFGPFVERLTALVGGASNGAATLTSTAGGISP